MAAEDLARNYNLDLAYTIRRLSAIVAQFA
jgi:hypothetical protein